MINHVKYKEEGVLVKTFFQHVKVTDKEVLEFIAKTMLQP